LAISWDIKGNNLRLIPTAYTIPTDNIIMVKVIGSQSGRIFMAGNNGNMYELEYKSVESAWSAVFGTGQIHKCQKLNHSTWNWKLVHLVPPFLRNILDVNDSLKDLAIDDLRNVLYTVSVKGILSAFYLGADGKANNPTIIKEFNVFEEVQRFLSYQNPPESSPRGSVFRDTKSMIIIGVYIIPLTESRKVHLIVLLSNGIRIYLRLVGSDRMAFTPGPNPRGFRPPENIEVLYVRNPPSPEAIRCSLPGSQIENGMELGCVPAYLPMNPLKIHTGMYAHGLLFAATDKESTKDDNLLCLFEDLAGRNTVPTAPVGGNMVFPTQIPSLREGVCMASDDNGNPVIKGAIFDIKESCMNNDDALVMQSLYATSSTSVSYGISEDTPHNELPPYNPLTDASESPPGPGLAISSAGQTFGELFENICLFIALYVCIEIDVMTRYVFVN
jgi:hypothetical protein